MSRTQDVHARNDELAREKKLYEARIARLNKRIDDLLRAARQNREAAQLHEQLEMSRGRVLALEAKVDAQTEEINGLHRRLQTKEGGIHARVKEIGEELEVVRARLQDSMADCTRKADIITSLEADVAELKQERNELSTKFRTAQSDLDFLQVGTWIRPAPLLLLLLLLPFLFPLPFPPA